MKNLHLEAVFHEPKSRFAYAYNTNELHIRLMTKKGSIDNVSLLYGDPFDWVKIDGEYKWKFDTTPMKKERSTDLHDYWQITVSTKHKRFKYAFILEDKVIYGSNFNYKIDKLDTLTLREQFNLFHFPFISESDVLKTPEWLNDIVWYHIFPDRFYATDPLVDWENTKAANDIIFGGSLKGIEEKLPYLKELGITGIYLNPIFESPSAHKYDTKDYLKVDPSFGTNQDLKDLVDKIHELDMKVMLDAVFNHCGWEYPIFQDVVKKGKESKYYDWFLQFEDPMINFNIIDGQPEKGSNLPNYYTFATTKLMPKWNTSNPEVQEHLIAIAKEWITEFDIDAIRYDVADEVSHDFWIRLNHSLKDVKEDVYHLAEAWHSGNPFVDAHQFNGVMNYKLMLALDDYLTDTTNSTEFAYAINKLIMLYPENAMANMFNIIDSHDTERALNKYNHHTKLGIIFMMLFPGRPSIYYGTEMDLAGGTDPDNRRPFPWNKEKGETFKLIQALSEIKRTYNPQKLDWIYTKDALIFELDEILVILSKENETIIVPEGIRGIYKNMLTNEKVELQDRIKLHSNEYFILKKGS